MFNFEEGKRKLPSTNNLKNAFGSNSHNNLMSTLDKKRSDISKDKYIVCYLEPGTIICLKPMTPLIPKAVLSSILDRSRTTKITKISKLPISSTKKSSRLNFPKNLLWISLNLESKSMSTSRISYPTKNWIWMMLIVKEICLSIKDRKRKIRKSLKDQRKFNQVPLALMISNATKNFKQRWKERHKKRW